MTTVKFAWLVPALALATAPALAANKAPPKHHPAAQKPDPALLEFLGTWESRDGRWVDPMTFARIDPDKTQQDKARQDGKLPETAKPPNKDDAGGSGV
jgi:hypothetical protein